MILLNILLAAVLFYVILKWDVKSDLKKLNEGKLVKHGVEWVFRALLLSPTVLLLSLPFYLDSTLEIILKLSISAALTLFGNCLTVYTTREETCLGDIMEVTKHMTHQLINF